MADRMISPGVRVNVIDDSQYTTPRNSIGTSFCIIGAAQKGPTMEPTLITEFTQKFGVPIDLAGLTASKALKQGGSVYYLRIADGTETHKTVTLPSNDSKNVYSVKEVTVTSGGTGYQENDQLTLTGGTIDATFKVTKLASGGEGVIEAVELVNAGSFSTDVAGTITPTGGSGTGASFTITTETTPQISSGLVLTAKSAGTLAEGVWKAIISGDTNGVFSLSIVRQVGTADPIVVIPPTQLSFDKDESNYFEKFTGNGDWTLAPLNQDLIPTQLVAGTYLMSTGSNGVDLTNLENNASTIEKAIELIEDPESYNFIYISAPKYSSVEAIATRMVTLAKTRDLSVVQIDHSESLESTSDVITALEKFTGKDNSQVALWAGLDLYTTDDYNNGQLIPVPPSVVIIPALAGLYSSSPEWTPPASANKIPLTELKSATAFSKNDRDKLYEANINPICNYLGLGWTAMGQKSGQTKKSALDRLNVRQLVNYVKKQLTTMSTDFLFSPIDQATFNDWTYRANQILDQIRVGRGLYDYIVKLDFNTTTSDDINNNTMRPIIKIKPTKVAEYIDIDLVIKNYSDEL